MRGGRRTVVVGTAALLVGGGALVVHQTRSPHTVEVAGSPLRFEATVTRNRVPLGTRTLTDDLVHVAVAGRVWAIYVGSAREDLVGPVTHQVLTSLRTD